MANNKQGPSSMIFHFLAIFLYMVSYTNGLVVTTEKNLRTQVSFKLKISII